MKKDLIKKTIPLLMACLSLTFFSCGDDEEEEEFDLGTNVYQFTSDTLTLTGVSGKEIYLAKVNGSNKTDSSPAYVSTSECTGLSASLLPSLSVQTTENEEEILPVKKHYVMSDLEKELAKEFGRLHVQKYGKPSRAALQALYSVHESDLSVDDTDDIYIQTGDSAYEEQASTLKAAGTYCNVWVVDDNYDDLDDEGDISTIATKFDAIYPIITKVFGTECDKIYNYAYDESKGSFVGSIVEMADCEGNDTGTKINIVLCDLPDGYDGYFASKDYYYYDTELETSGDNMTAAQIATNIALNASNVGKYFYIDIGSVNTSLDNSLLTLAHEFQHMINFNMKTVQNSATFSTFFDEMCSMVCEDMMASYLGVSDDDTPKNRLPLFNKKYTETGTGEWVTDTSNQELYSYSSAYAFGAWLARQYGGAKLFNAMLTNSHSDMDAVTEAVNSVSGEEYTDEQLIERYVQALVFTSTDFTHPTMNQAAKQTLTYSSGSSTYSYPMTAINLWKLDEALPTYSSANTNSSYYKYDGPSYLTASDTTPVRPYGFTLHEIGTASSDSVTLKLSANPISSSTKYYVLVQ